MNDESTVSSSQPTAMSAAPSGVAHGETEMAQLPPEATATSPADSGTRAVLRDAIQKVMDEIQHHEREAKRHLQMAQDLRKELRESVAFLQAGGQPAKGVDVSKVTEHVAKAKARDTDEKSQRAGSKKGAPGKRK